jgi:hypothetical protein
MNSSLCQPDEMAKRLAAETNFGERLAAGTV